MSEPNFAKHIRSCIDGEGEPEQEAVIQQRADSDEQLAARIRFEQTLRERVGHAMRGKAPAAPEGLAEQIRKAWAEIDESEGKINGPGPTSKSTSSSPATSASPTRAEHPRRLWFSGTRLTSFLAIAAVLAMIAGAVLFSIFGPRVEQGPSDLLIEAVRFTSMVTDMCENDPKLLADKTYWRQPNEAQRQLAEHLAVPAVTVVNLDQLGYAFYGAGRCQVPGVDASGHMVYRQPATDESDREMVSVFIVADVGQYPGLPLASATDPWQMIRAGPDSIYLTHCVSDGSVVYFLVCTDANDLETVKQAVARGLGLVQ